MPNREFLLILHRFCSFCYNYPRDADTAISQIKRRNYPEKVSQYADNLLLVGINYDRETKQHECHIEKYEAMGM